MEIIVSTKELANFFDVSLRGVQKWGQSGCPRIGRGRWNLKAVFAWWWTNIALEKAADCDTSLTEARRLYWTAKAEREQLKAEIERGNYVAVEDLQAAWGIRVTEIVSMLENLKHRLPGPLEGKTQTEIFQIVEKEIHLIRSAYYREEKFTVFSSPETRKKVINLILNDLKEKRKSN